jgi:N-acetyl sugar amidotransferase
MDFTDPSITFDENGVCNYAPLVESYKGKYWHPNEKGHKMLEDSIDKIKADSKGRPYDCIIGLSGGLDSSYLAYKLRSYNLRALVVHIDAGWNSETSVQNIEKIIKYNDWDLYTHVMDWEEMKDLQLAYLKAGLVNQDVPQDHAFFATLWKIAAKNKIKWVLSGGNMASESILPNAWRGHDAMDGKHLLAVHKRFGNIKLKKYKTASFIGYNLYFRWWKGMKVFKPLNLMVYERETAIQELESNVGWKSYGDKHHESVFTKFFQGYYLPTKFGFDKRKAHLSSMILSGQITRDQALEELSKLPYKESEIGFQKDYISKKLGISLEELESHIKNANCKDDDFPSGIKIQQQLIGLKAKAKKYFTFKGQEYG